MIMKIVKAYLQNGQYINQQYSKKALFFHHTAGTTAAGALGWWDQTPEPVGTAYVVDRDGIIYEAFDPTMFAYHLGIVNDDNYFEKHGIGIELVSAGKLHKVGEKYLFYPLYPNLFHYTEIPKEEVGKLSTPYKGVELYHKYSEKQLEVAEELARKIIAEFNITVQDNPEDFYQYNPEITKKHLPGIWSHGAVNPSSIDVVPQPELVSMITKLGKDFKGTRIKEVEITADKPASSKKSYKKS